MSAAITSKKVFKTDGPVKGPLSVQRVQGQRLSRGGRPTGEWLLLISAIETLNGRIVQIVGQAIERAGLDGGGKTHRR